MPASLSRLERTDSPTPAAAAGEVAALEERARAANSLNSLAFSIANDPYPLLSFRQALVFDCAEPAWQLLAVSGLARPTEDSPYLVWLRRAAAWLAAVPMSEQGLWLAATTAELPEEIASGLAEWWPDGIWCLRIVDRNKQLSQAGGTTTATGSFTVKRLDFKIGEGEWADTSVVANDVTVKFKLALNGLGPL